jgi:hypothetical protein
MTLVLWRDLHPSIPSGGCRTNARGHALRDEGSAADSGGQRLGDTVSGVYRRLVVSNFVSKNSVDSGGAPVDRIA